MVFGTDTDLRLEQRDQHKPDEPDHRGNLADSSLNKPEFGFRYTHVPLDQMKNKFDRNLLHQNDWSYNCIAQALFDFSTFRLNSRKPRCLASVDV
jgi:hypothetical protein